MNKAKILLVDDDPVCTGVVLSMLDTQYEIISVNSGRSGLSLMALMRPDLILLDISMQDVNGYQVLRQLKGNEATAAIPIVVISSLTEAFDIDFALRLGANGYLTKPLSPNEVDRTIRQLLRTADVK